MQTTTRGIENEKKKFSVLLEFGESKKQINIHADEAPEDLLDTLEGHLKRIDGNIHLVIMALSIVAVLVSCRELGQLTYYRDFPENLWMSFTLWRLAMCLSSTHMKDQ